MVCVNRLNGLGNELPYALQRQPESIDGGFQPLEQVDTHQAADAFLTAHLCERGSLVVGQVDVLGHLARQDKIAGRIDGQVEHEQHIINIVIIDGSAQVCQIGTHGDGLEAFGELADFCCGIVFLNMPAAAGNGDAVQHLKEVKVEGFQQSIRGALLRRQLAPRIERLLCVAENFVDSM